MCDNSSFFKDAYKQLLNTRLKSVFGLYVQTKGQS